MVEIVRLTSLVSEWGTLQKKSKAFAALKILEPIFFTCRRPADEKKLALKFIPLCGMALIFICGDSGTRTHDPLHAMQVL